MIKKYFKINWEEFAFDKEWGTSIWYLELDSENYPTRQLEVYKNGNRAKFTEEHWCDSYGSLGDQPISLDEIEKIEIEVSEFETEWKIKSLNLD